METPPNYFHSTPCSDTIHFKDDDAESLSISWAGTDDIDDMYGRQCSLEKRGYDVGYMSEEMEYSRSVSQPGGKLFCKQHSLSPFQTFVPEERCDVTTGCSDPLARAILSGHLQCVQGYEELALDHKSLSIQRVCVEGALGKVFLGIYKDEDVAVKILEEGKNISSNTSNNTAEEIALRELEIRNRVGDHPNIARLRAVSKRLPLMWCLITEHSKEGTVREYIERLNGVHIPIHTAVGWAIDISRAMAHLHSLDLVHSNLNSHNIVIANDKSAKVTNIGGLKIEVCTEGFTPETGAYRWMAPEQIQHRPAEKASDVFSFGIILWELLTGDLPHSSLSAVQAAFAVAHHKQRPKIPDRCPPRIHGLLQDCWLAEPSERPSFARISDLLKLIKSALPRLNSSNSFTMRGKLCCVGLPHVED